MPGGSEEQTFTMRFNPFPWESTHSDTADLTILAAQLFQGSWSWMSGAPWSFAPWGEGISLQNKIMGKAI